MPEVLSQGSSSSFEAFVVHMYMCGGKEEVSCAHPTTLIALSRSKEEGRLGIEDTEQLYNPPGYDLIRGIPFPVELPMSHTRTISIVAGGWYVY